MTPCQRDFSIIFEFGFEPDIDGLVAPASGLLPDFLALQACHDKFVGIDGVHFFADDTFDFLDNADAER